MADPDAEQEAPGMGSLGAVVRPCDIDGRGCPDVDDAGRDLEGAGRIQERLGVREASQETNNLGPFRALNRLL